MDTQQRDAVEEFVRDKKVIDLGCGDAGWTEMMVIMGPKLIIAVDKQLPRDTGPPRQIKWVEKTFQDYENEGGEVPEVAFVSWPVNRPLPALLRMVQKAKVVIYLGKNTDGTSCGWPELFAHFSGRELLRHVPKRANTLTVYGGPVDEPRMLTGEEVAARFFAVDKFLPYDEAEALASEADVVTQLGWRG
jgi:hypothetical protein